MQRVKHYIMVWEGLETLCGLKKGTPNLTSIRKNVTCKRCLKSLKTKNYMPEV